MNDESTQLNKALDKAVKVLETHSNCIDYIDYGSDHYKEYHRDNYTNCADCLRAWLMSGDDPQESS